MSDHVRGCRDAGKGGKVGGSRAAFGALPWTGPREPTIVHRRKLRWNLSRPGSGAQRPTAPIGSNRMKLYRLSYSPYVLKVQIVLDLLGMKYEPIDVPYGRREELAELTGGYIQVPVLVDDAGAVTVDSRAICEKLLSGPAGQRVVPP